MLTTKLMNERIYIMHTDCMRKILYTFSTNDVDIVRDKNREREKKSNWNDIFKRIQFNFKLNYLFANFIESILFIPHTRTSSSFCCQTLFFSIFFHSLLQSCVRDWINILIAIFSCVFDSWIKNLFSISFPSFSLLLFSIDASCRVMRSTT